MNLYLILHYSLLYLDKIVLPSGTGLQIVNGSPEYFVGHEHIGIWFTTSQFAPCPHVPIHGSRHLFLIQALSLEHSVFNTHSGRQFS